MSRILIVKNDRATLIELVKFLRPKGFIVDHTHRVDIAWEYFRTLPTDLVLTDHLFTNGASGLVLAELVKNSKNQAPVILQASRKITSPFVDLRIVEQSSFQKILTTIKRLLNS